MDAEQPSAPTVGGALRAPKQNLLSEFSEELQEQSELLNALEQRLDMVRSPLPQNDASQKAVEQRPHLSTLIRQVGRNNRRIATLIDEIDL